MKIPIFVEVNTRERTSAYLNKHLAFVRNMEKPWGLVSPTESIALWAEVDKKVPSMGFYIWIEDDPDHEIVPAYHEDPALENSDRLLVHDRLRLLRK